MLVISLLWIVSFFIKFVRSHENFHEYFSYFWKLYVFWKNNSTGFLPYLVLCIWSKYTGYVCHRYEYKNENKYYEFKTIIHVKDEFYLKVYSFYLYQIVTNTRHTYRREIICTLWPKLNNLRDRFISLDKFSIN